MQKPIPSQTPPLSCLAVFLRFSWSEQIKGVCMNYGQQSAGRDGGRGEIYLPMGLPFLQDRGLLPTRDGVELCKRWIVKHLEKTPKFSYKISSYTYKHYVERAAKVYVANQDFIVAMHDLGWTMKQIAGNTPNWYFRAKVKPEFVLADGLIIAKEAGL